MSCCKSAANVDLGFNAEREKGALGTANKVGKNCWSINSSFKMMGVFDIGNRGMLVNLPDKKGKGKGALVLINAVKPTETVVSAIKAIEEKKGSELKYVVLPGGGHSIFAKDYPAVWPKAKICINSIAQKAGDSGVKGIDVHVMDNQDPFPELKDQLSVFTHILQTDGLSKMVQKAMKVPAGCVFEERAFYHHESKTLYAGDHVMFLPKVGAPFRLPPFSFKSGVWFTPGPMYMMMNTPAAKERAAQIHKKMSKLDIDRFLCIHGFNNIMVGEKIKQNYLDGILTGYSRLNVSK